jgi:GNAT superfamily N-acetyltransferase
MYATKSLAPDDLVEQSQWDTFWLPADVRVVERPELLYLSCPRDVLMLNSVTRTRADANGLQPLIDEVCLAHSQVRSRWLVRELAQRTELENQLAKAGYQESQVHDTYTLASAHAFLSTATGFRVERVENMSHLRDAITVLDEVFGQSAASDEAELQLFFAACTGPQARVQRFVAYDKHDGSAVATGAFTAYASLRFAYLWGGGTVPRARGRGCYRAVLAARIARAHELGLQRVGLYAIRETSAPILARLGFEKHAAMSYWDRPVL